MSINEDAIKLAAQHRKARVAQLPPDLAARYHIHLAKAECVAMAADFGLVNTLQKDVVDSLGELEAALHYVVKPPIAAQGDRMLDSKVLGEILCKAFGIDPLTVTRIIVDCNVGDVARVITYTIATDATGAFLMNDDKTDVKRELHRYKLMEEQEDKQ